MIDIYINGALRSDIELLEGAQLSHTSDHKTSSAPSVSVPVDAVQPQECDYIKIITENESREQVETITITGAWNGVPDRDLRVTVTAAVLGGAVSGEFVAGVNYNTAEVMAETIRYVVNNKISVFGSGVGTHFTASGTGAVVSLIAKTAAANDTIMNIAVSNPHGATGFDSIANSENTMEGIAPTQTNLFSGTILGLQQRNLGYADFNRCVYDLSVASNADYLASVCADMIIPEGATITEILLGGFAGDAEFDETVADYTGLFEKRIQPEGITLGTVDEIGIKLDATVNLSGVYVTDILDEMAEAADAWWEITPDKVFNFRLSSTRSPAPFILDESADIYDLSVSRDAFTLYSACRVIGSTEGKGTPIKENLLIQPAEGEHKTPIAFASRPIYAVNNKGYRGAPLTYAYDAVDPPMQNGALFCKYAGFERNDNVEAVGVAGLDDGKGFNYFYSYGSTAITAADEYYNFMDTYEWGDTYYQLAYYPLVPVIVRVVDEKLKDEITAQRGGTGIIEYIIEDDNITDFSTAGAVAAEFLANNSKRAKTVKFKTKTHGVTVGQVFSGSDIPYYGVTGDYKVTSVKSSAVSGVSGLMWEYEVEASNAEYRDPLKMLTVGKTQTFALNGADTASLILQMALSLGGDIDIQTTLTISAIQPITWDTLESYGSWNTIETYTWAAIENVSGEEITVGSYLTTAGKARLAAALATPGLYNKSLYLSTKLRLYNAAGTLLKEVTPLGRALASGASAINAFYLYEGDANGTIDHAEVVDSAGVVLQEITGVDYTKTAGIVLSITKKDEVV